MFPTDPMDSIGPLSNPSPLKEFQNIVYTSGNLSGADCTSDLICRPETPLDSRFSPLESD